MCNYTLLSSYLQNEMDISRPLGSVGGVLGGAPSASFAWFLGFWPTMLCIIDAALFTTPCRVMLCCRLAFDVLLDSTILLTTAIA